MFQIKSFLLDCTSGPGFGEYYTPSDHQHTGQQLQLYQQFSSIQAEGDIYCSIQLTPTYVNETILLFPSVNNMFILSPTDAFNLRAPPSNL